MLGRSMAVDGVVSARAVRPVGPAVPACLCSARWRWLLACAFVRVRSVGQPAIHTGIQRVSVCLSRLKLACVLVASWLPLSVLVYCTAGEEDRRIAPPAPWRALCFVTSVSPPHAAAGHADGKATITHAHTDPTRCSSSRGRPLAARWRSQLCCACLVRMCAS